VDTRATAFGPLLRQWRQARRVSQMELALRAEVSTRHLSWLETGRAMPSRAMALRLAETLDVPLRERNALLTAAGFAPLYRERPLADPALAPVRAALQRLLDAHEPWPALAVDRHWNLVAHNRLVPLLIEQAAPALRLPPINVLRLSLHPQGLAPMVANLPCWRGCSGRSPPPATPPSPRCSPNCARCRCPTHRLRWRRRPWSTTSPCPCRCTRRAAC